MEQLLKDILQSGGLVGPVLVASIVGLVLILKHTLQRDEAHAGSVERVVEQFSRMQEQTCVSTRAIMLRHVEDTRDAIEKNTEAVGDMKSVLVEVRALLKARNGR